MRKSSKCGVFLILMFFLLPLINFVAATPSYVDSEIEEDKEYIWSIDFDEVIYDHYYADTNDTSVPKYNDDLKGIKVKIDEIEGEKDYSVNYQNESRGIFSGVEIHFKYYETESNIDNDD